VWRDAAGHALVARVLDPATTAPFIDDRTGRKLYAVDGRTLDATEVTHLRMMKRPGKLLGLGPIQAAQAELAGHRDVVDASTNWFRDSGTPAGYLHTEQAMTPDQAKALLEAWNSVPAGRTRVATHGLKYDANIINPRDAQWLESRRFSKTEIMDLFGIPASLTLGVDKGASDTYANVSQDWLGFVRFRLMRYVREIEEALSSLIPRGQYARANLEALLRSDAKTRMEIHAIAVANGIYSGDYARSIEHIPATAAPTPQEVTA
jgi:HK97 family phage portal protein